MSFNIKQDLAHRDQNQQLEILAISGPSSSWVMERLKTLRFSEIEARFGISVNAENAARIVQRYGARI